MSIYNYVGTQDDALLAGSFLDSHAAARKHMTQAAKRLLAFKRTVSDKDAAKRYDVAHKKMTRLLREWNQIEHEREKQ